MTRPHPSAAVEIAWDEGNEAELAAHGIRLPEIEEVWQGSALFVPNKRRRAGDWKMIGLTRGGRLITIVFRYDAQDRSISR